MLRRCASHRFLQPISVLMYHPLKGAAVNSRPPQSNSMLATAGSAYQRRSSFSNQSNLRIEKPLYFMPHNSAASVNRNSVSNIWKHVYPILMKHRCKFKERNAQFHLFLRFQKKKKLSISIIVHYGFERHYKLRCH
jgi:hypothetical protein